ncbi:MAG: hypothetical protein MJA82_17150 [Clostridia bacterium]|nr:hypothetical protein [Clostridia bacterium]
MSYLNERVSYLKGLADGMELDNTTKEGKLLVHIIDVLEDFADSVSQLDEGLTEVSEYVEAIDEDLTELEDDFYDELEELDDEDYIDFDEIKCPTCGEIICLDEDLFDGEQEGDVEIACPECNESIHITEDCDDCCCEH